jgi:hypothetical protein
MKLCKKCGFLLGSRPGLKDEDGICQACINSEKKKTIDFKARQAWLTKYIKENKGNRIYDCVIAVSGGKDSHMIVKRLIENHEIKNPLLITTLDEFTQTKAGIHNLKNLGDHFDVDQIYYRYKPKTAKKEIIRDFEKHLNPLIEVDDRMVGGHGYPANFARNFGIKLVFYGENAAFEYGNQEELNILHPDSDEQVSIIFLGAIYPYSITDSLKEARSVGFKDLDDFNEWNRQGLVDNYTQIDSIAYVMHQWTKFVKFGSQRTSDIACRLVREGVLTRDQALLYIKERDYICDPMAKRDFCKSLGITEKHFDEVVDKFANPNVVVKDVNGVWRRKDLL